MTGMIRTDKIMNHEKLEIERKYLIRMPDEAALGSMPGCETWQISQTYLSSSGNGYTSRLRRMVVEGREVFIHTEKRRVSALSCEEDEREISRAEYDALMQQADPALRTIEKKRCRIPYAGRMMEIDIYSFWSDRATLEVELESEEAEVSLPPWLDIVRELTGEAAYKNYALARQIPMEALA